MNGTTVELDRKEVRKQVEHRILRHAEGSINDLAGSLVNYCFSYIMAHREEWTSHGYDQGYFDARTELKNGWTDE